MASAKRPVALTYGLIAGLVIVIITYILYMGGVNTYLGGLAFLNYVAMITLAVIAAWSQKKAQGGYLEFREALQTIFTVFAIALLMLTLFNWVLMNYLDINFKNAVSQETIKRMEELLRRMKMDDDQIDKAVNNARHNDSFTLGKLFLGLMFWYIAAFLFALLIAAIVKKKKPEFADAL